MKKFLLCLLTMCMISTCLQGCKKNEEIVDENGVMTISIMNVGDKGDYENCYSKELIEKTFNIKIKTEFMTNEEYIEKRALLFGSGKIPDVIYHLDPQYLSADAEQGFLAEVPYETIKQYAPGYVKYYDEKNYGIPNLYLVGNDPKLSLWRLDWLKKVGIERVPDTIEEMHDAFLKIANADIDGDGKKNTYCISTDMMRYSNTFADVFGAYGLLPFHFMEKDEKVVYGGTLPEVKEVLGVLNQWYEEGIIHPDFITDDYAAMNTKFQNGQLAYDYMVGNDIYSTNESSVANLTKALNPGAELAYSVPVAGPEGSRGGYQYGLGGHIICFGKHIENQPQKLEKILEMIEYMNENEEFLMKTKIGEEGVHYKLTDAAKGIGGGIEWLAPYDNQEERNKAGLTDLGGIHNMYAFHILPVRIDTFAKYRPIEKRRVLEEIEGDFSQYYKTDIFMKSDVVPRSNEFLASIRAAQSEIMMGIISGKYPIDKYDEFINEFNGALSGNILVEEANSFKEIQDSIIEQMR